MHHQQTNRCYANLWNSQAISSFFNSLFDILEHSVCLDAKHVNNKAAKKAHKNRPKKSRPSDINRAPVVYPTFTKPAEYTIVSEN